MRKGHTSKLVKGVFSCTASVALTLGLLGVDASRALAETMGADGVQVVGEADETAAQDGADQAEAVAQQDGGVTFGSGIGAGDESYGVTVDISGGTVEACGGRFAAGIGTGDKAKGTCDVNISGGEVLARGGTESAGIGGGGYGNGGDITISGGHVRAIGGMKDGTSFHDCGGSGIGGGHGGKGGNVQIRGGVVEAAGGVQAAAIGHGACGDDDGSLYITDDYMVRGVFTIDQGKKDRRGLNDPVATERIDEWYKQATLADTDERIPFCKYRSYVVTEPCNHADAVYTQVEGGHKVSCKHCESGDMSMQEHDFGSGDVCKQCGFEVHRPKFASPCVDAVAGMGPTFWLEIPRDGTVKVDKVELSVGGKRARTECLTIDDAQRDGNGDFKAQVSMLGYIASMMRHSGDDSTVKVALASIYWYFGYTKGTVN